MPEQELKLELTPLPNRLEVLTGNPVGNILDRYPLAFKYYEDNTVDPPIFIGKSFDQIIFEGGSFELTSFPYSVGSDLDRNPMRWGLYINESIHRTFLALDSIAVAYDLANNITLINNVNIMEYFNKVESNNTSDFNFLRNYSSDTVDKILYFIPLVSRFIPLTKSYIQDNELVNRIIDRLTEVMDLDDLSFNPLKDDIINNKNIIQHTIEDDRLMLPYARVKDDSAEMISVDFDENLLPIKLNNATRDMHAINLQQGLELAPLHTRLMYTESKIIPDLLPYTNLTNLIVNEKIYIGPNVESIYFDMEQVDFINVDFCDKNFSFQQKGIESVGDIFLSNGTMINNDLILTCDGVVKLVNIHTEFDLIISNLKYILIESCSINRISINGDQTHGVFIDIINSEIGSVNITDEIYYYITVNGYNGPVLIDSVKATNLMLLNISDKLTI